ncbi:MAG: RraA family protein [Anaerolineae bacterium]|nr:RraA family protein [Anaerolineae bacterium]
MSAIKQNYEYRIPVEDLIRRYRALYSGAVYDALDELGLPHQALAVEVKPIRQDMVLAGPAFTIKGVSDSVGDEELRNRRIHLFNDMRALGCPVVDIRDVSFDDQVAHYGEMNAVLGRASGAIGAVIDGGCRDTGFLLRQDFPVWCRYQTPVEAFKRWSYTSWQKPIGLRGAISSVVTVYPGDFVFADLDGVLIIPRALVEEVLEKTEKVVHQENQARAEFTTTDDIVAVYRKYGRL